MAPNSKCLCEVVSWGAKNAENKKINSKLFRKATRFVKQSVEISCAFQIAPKEPRRRRMGKRSSKRVFLESPFSSLPP